MGVALLGVTMLSALLLRQGPEAVAQPAGKAKAKAEVRVGGLSVARPVKGDKFGRSMASGLQAGTNVSLRVSIPGRQIIELDRAASTLTKFTDDKGTVLAKPGKGGGFKSWLSPFTHIAEDGQSCAPDIRSKKLPAAGATRLAVDATLVFVCGQDPKTAKCEAALTKGAAVKLGPIDAKVSKVGKPQFGRMKVDVTFTSTRSFDAIRKLTFLGGDGKEIKSRRASSGRSTLGDVSTYSLSYGLASKVDKVIVKVDYWGSVETVTVAVKLNFGLGL